MTIEIIIDSTGAATLQTKGIAGPGCREASRWLETVVGRVVADRMTADFHQNQTTITHAQQEQA